MQHPGEFLKQPESERIKILEELRESLEVENVAGNDELSNDQEEEIQKRIVRIQAGKSKLYTWDEVKSEAGRTE